MDIPVTEIEYKGKNGTKKISSKFYSDVTEDELITIQKGLYDRPDLSKVHRALYDVYMGSTDCSVTDRYYINDLLYKVQYYGSIASISDAVTDKGLMGLIKGAILAHPSMYDGVGLTVDTFLTFCRVGGTHLVKKAYNFPLSWVDYILQEYPPVNGVVYDYSCGWGNRLLGTLRNNYAYCGTDPSTELIKRLKQEYADFQSICDIPNADIRGTGSEIFHSDWENTMGLSFSSPPYFDMELYPGVDLPDTLDRWVTDYLSPTIQNIYRYLVHGAYFLMNIKDYGKYHFFDMIQPIADRVGFQYVKTDHLSSSNSRTYLVQGKRTKVQNVEPLYVFRKG